MWLVVDGVKWTPEIDEDGYPTEECLLALRKYLELRDEELISTLRARVVSCIETFIEACPYASGGMEDVEIRGETSAYLSFHTAGWSGAEDFIDTLRECPLVWMSCWERSDAGGHFYFKASCEEEK